MDENSTLFVVCVVLVWFLLGVGTAWATLRLDEYERKHRP